MGRHYLEIIKELKRFLDNQEADARGLSPELKKMLAVSTGLEGARPAESQMLEQTDFRLKARILCHRLERFTEQAEKAVPYMGKEGLADYYLRDNRLKELNWLGFGWYADALFEERRATLYKIDDGSREISWRKDWNRLSGEDKSSGARALQAIFDLCKKHIGIGNEEIWLDSWSECLGVDLFKYASLDKNGAARLFVMKGAEVNVVRTSAGYDSLQNFARREETVESCEFSVGFSSARNENRENFNSWYRTFMQEDFLSDSECRKLLDMDKREFSMDFIYRVLKKEEQSRRLTLMVSPIADREVVTSGGLWGEETLHVSLGEEELCQLLYCYYQEAVRRKKVEKVESEDFLKKYHESLSWMEGIFEEFEKKNSSVEEQGKDAEEKLREILKYLRARMEMWRGLPGKEAGEKITAVLSLVNWEEESIPDWWGIGNIYKRERKDEEAAANLGMDLYKQILQRVR